MDTNLVDTTGVGQAVVGALMALTDQAERMCAITVVNGHANVPTMSPSAVKGAALHVEGHVRRGRYVTAAAAMARMRAPLRALAPHVAENRDLVFRLGEAIARGNPADLDDLVHEVCPNAWGDVRDDRLNPAARRPDYVPGAMPARFQHRLAALADDAIQLNPGWAAHYGRAEFDAIFGEEDDAGGGGTNGQPKAQTGLEPDGPDASGFVSLHHALARKIPPRDFVAAPIFERGRVTMLTGVPGCGETTLLAHLALAVASGQPWAGFTIPSSGRVLWVNCEEPLEESTRRLAAAARAMGLARRDESACAAHARIRVWAGGGALRIAGRGAEGLKLTEQGKRLCKEIEDFRPDLVICDPFTGTHLLDENSNADMSDFFDKLTQIARAANCAIAVAHHDRKSSGKTQEGSMDSARGASSIAGAVRSMWQVRADRDGTTVLECTKANNFRKPESGTKFMMGTVTLKNGDDVGVLVPSDRE